MEDIKNIYKLLLHSEGLKIRDISNKLGLDKYYVADVLLSEKCQSYWYENDSSLWFAIEGALKVEEPIKEEFPELPFSTKPVNLEKHLTGITSQSLQIYIKDISKYSKYTEKETGILFSLYHSGDEKAFDALVKGHLSLVLHIAIRFKNKGIELEDLIQEGNIGLIYAIENYSYFRRESFIVYAQNIIIQSIKEYIEKQTCFLTISKRHIQYYKVIHKLVEKYEVQFGIPPSINDIWFDDVPERFSTYLFNLPNSLSELAIFTEDLDKFPSGEKEPDNNLMKESTRYEVHRMLHWIDERDKKIIMDYYGIDRSISENYSTIGDKLQMSRERIRQIVQDTTEHFRDILDGVIPIKKRTKVETPQGKKQVATPSNEKEIKASQNNIHSAEEKRESTSLNIQLEKKKVHVGDTIEYKSRVAIVRAIRKSIPHERLILKYSDGTVDNVINDTDNYIIVKRAPNNT